MGDNSIYKKAVRKYAAVKSLLKIKPVRLPEPRIVFTGDMSEPDLKRDLQVFFDKFSHYQIPLTFFVCNRKVDGRDNLSAINQILLYSKQKDILLELGTHSTSHLSLSEKSPEETAGEIARSIIEFKKSGIHIEGFRSPYLSTEKNYPEYLLAYASEEADLIYDSSICFESGILSSLFNKKIRKKGPHKIGKIWEFPISTLDDHHLIWEMKKSDSFLFRHWTGALNFWIKKLGYCMFLFHPFVIKERFDVFDRFLSYCADSYPKHYFKTCGLLARELNALEKSNHNDFE